MANSDKHDKRRRRWQSRVTEKTRSLSELLTRKLAPIIEAVEFAKVDREFARADRPVEGSELRYERELGEHVDVLYVFFDKYSSPRFQIGFSRRKMADRDLIVRSGHLVQKSSQYYHEWGKPRWLPLALWSEAQARATVDEVAESLPQVFSFLEFGVRGSRISQSTDSVRKTPGKSG